MASVKHTDGMLKPGTFDKKTVVITGGGTGLGRSVGKYLLSLGANLVICGRRKDVIEKTAAELERETGGKVLGTACDVRQPEQVDALVAAAYQRFGAVDCLLNNAAGNFICPTERLSYNAVNTVVDIVLKGSYNCTLAFGKRWIADGRPASVLSIGTTYAWTGSGYVVPSAMGKAGVLVMTRSLAAEWGKYGIRLNVIAPGPFPTEGAWSRLMPPGMDGLFASEKRIPLGRLGEHQELANLAAYLLSEYSAYITGTCVTIDGGEWLRGAGEFNALEAVTREQWDMLQTAMKPKK
ncbi:MAG: SDR family oxidoreductase [Planctomycetia bacterium]|nr:SDR family oxidoreductase [Planctomycetia bacterium]